MKVIVLHTPGLNVNWLGAYGNEWVRTPHIDRLASEGVVFDQHHVTDPDPDVAEETWHTGDYSLSPSPEQARDFADRLALLEPHGVRFIRFCDGGEIEGAESVEFGQIVDAAIDALEQLQSEEHFVLWLDATRLLPPWQLFQELFQEYADDWIPPESLEDVPELEPWPDPAVGAFDSKDVLGRERLQRSFATSVTALDLELGGLIDEAHERNLDGGVLWLLTSGYGWPLAEHSIVGPAAADVHEESVHVPLIVRFPDKAQAGRRIDALTQSVDVLPTLFELFGVTADGLHGKSVLPLARGEVPSIRDYAVFCQVVGDIEEWGLRTPDWCYQVRKAGPDRPPRLFEKPADRWEVNDLRQQHLDWCDQLSVMLDVFAAEAVKPGAPAWPELPVENAEPEEEST